VNELERTLVSLGRELALPEAPDIVGSVLTSVAPRERPQLPRRRLVLAVALVLVALVAATLAIPSARSALFRALHIGGEEIHVVDRLPAVRPPARLDRVLGSEVSLAEARRAAGFPLHELDEKPDRVYLGELGTVWFLYGTPEHVRLLLAQTPHESVDRRFFQKFAAGGTRVEPLFVDGAPGVFLSGNPHLVIILDRSGRPVAETARLAHSVLVWSRGGVAYRLEGDLTRDQALDLASQLR
jgi:hypothetical protein